MVKYQLWKTTSGIEWIERDCGRREVKNYQRLIAESENRAALEQLKGLTRAQ